MPFDGDCWVAMRAPQYGNKRAGRKPMQRGAAEEAARAVACADMPFKPQPVHVRLDASQWANRARMSRRLAAAHNEPVSVAWGYKAAYNLAGAVPLSGGQAASSGKRIRYRSPKTALYADGTLGAPATVRLNHKSAPWHEGVRDDTNNPVVSKAYVLVKSRQ